MNPRLGRLNPSILTRIVALVAATLLLALGAMMLVAFRGPPPHSRPMMLGEAAALLQGAAAPAGSWTVARYRSDPAPLAEPGQMEDRRAAAQVATLLGARPADVRLVRELPPMRMADPDRKAWPVPGSGPSFGPDGTMLHRAFLLARRTADGWQVVQARQGANGRWYAITLSLMAGIFILLLLPAYWVARRITQPIRRLADGAATERPERADPLPLTGPPEVRAVGAAYNHMRARIADYLNERTAMLVAIAHDLRTPMTRLSFRLEALPDGPRAKAQADVQEMRAMVTDLLDFMRGQGEGAAQVRVDLSAIVETLADDLADMGQDVAVTHSSRAVVRGDAVALRRCIANLVENAVRYGGSARIAMTVTNGRVTVAVEDDGPGVPDAAIERLCEPFYRGEASRNRETGGVGLGLSIARRIADGHGGTLAFANRAGASNPSGLRASITLPLDR
ncbi:ATP-binding protein [Sphingobium cupriresistens]|uniref:histidine kinase n=1 Tax=Sphingobium cupriresistens LL01 TaxID=1420583 RepID=A0A0J7XRR6_9SPHN|nr:ATP-binding protein [Sphingobium cupriresistens]KMS54531.1 histidine kinase [Sphingobium cupriresistens LL01]